MFQGYHSQFRGKLFDRTIFQPFYTMYMHIIEASKRLVNIDFLSRGKGRKFTSTCYKFRDAVSTIIAYLVRDHFSILTRKKAEDSLKTILCYVSNRWKFSRECNVKNGEESHLWSYVSQRERSLYETLIVPFVFPLTPSPTCSNFSSSSFA